MSAISEPSDDPMTILYIDDEQPLLMARTAQLESEGFRVFPALTANAAVELFVAHQIDLVLSAMVLPDVSGAGLAVFMRQVRPEVSVVLLSRAARLPSTLLEQVDACVEKDSPMPDLLTCLRHVLAKRSVTPVLSSAMRCDAMDKTQWQN